MNRMLTDAELAMVDDVVRDVLRLDLPEVGYSFDHVPAGRVAESRALALAPAWMLLHSRGRWVVDSVEAGSRLYQRLRDQSGEGGSTWPDGLLVGHGKAYRVSYNGRVWRGERSDTPVSSPEGALAWIEGCGVRYQLAFEADGRAPGDETPARDPRVLNRVVLRAHAPAGIDSPEYCSIVLSPKVVAELRAAKQALSDPAFRDCVPQLRWGSEHVPRWGLHRLNLLPDEPSAFERDCSVDAAHFVVALVSSNEFEVFVVSRIRCDDEIEIYTAAVPLQYLLDAAAATAPVTFLDSRAEGFNGAALASEYRRDELDRFGELENAGEPDDDDSAPRP